MLQLIPLSNGLQLLLASYLFVFSGMDVQLSFTALYLSIASLETRLTVLYMIKVGHFE